MTKLGKAAVKAAAITCLAGCFFLANPYEPVVTEQQVYEMSTAAAGNFLEMSILKNTASEDMVNLNGNREVAGIAAIVSGDLDLQADSMAAGSAEAADSKEKDSAAVQKTETDDQKEAQAAETEKILQQCRTQTQKIRKQTLQKQRRFLSQRMWKTPLISGKSLMKSQMLWVNYSEDVQQRSPVKKVTGMRSVPVR